MGSFSTGLVSVTFRQLNASEIVALVAKAGQAQIEWGGDVHVPPTDIANATAVRRLTEEAGLTSAAYGSYYRVGHSEREGLPFAQVLDTAVALNAPTIRVWAGTRDSKDADDAYRVAVADDARRIASLAAQTGVRVAFEYHGGTISDNAAAALSLLEAADHPNLSTLWQPSVGVAPADRLGSLNAVLPRVAHVHVFQWDHPLRFPLADGAMEWRAYLDALSGANRAFPLLLEFVENDDPKAYLRDAATLREWIGG